MSSTDYSNEKVKPQQKIKRDQVIICEFLRNEIIKKQLHVSEIYYQKNPIYYVHLTIPILPLYFNLNMKTPYLSVIQEDKNL